MAHSGSMTRRAEVATVAAALEKHRILVYIEAPGTLDGGDVLTIGRQIFVGLSSRTNEAGCNQLSRAVECYGYRVTPVEVGRCLHLKTAVCPLDEESLLISPDWIDAGEFSGFRHIDVAEEEPFAANCLALNGVIHLSARCVRTQDLLEQRRIRDSHPRNHRVRKGGGRAHVPEPDFQVRHLVVEYRPRIDAAERTFGGNHANSHGHPRVVVSDRGDLAGLVSEVQCEGALTFTPLGEMRDDDRESFQQQYAFTGP